MGACPGKDCPARGSFIYTGKWVKRHAAILNGGILVFLIMLIALACCERCGRYARVLPLELLPRKRYGIAVIEMAARAYVFGEKGLRQIVDALPTENGRVPWHSSLHRWLIGFGEKILDRHKEILHRFPPTAATLFSETGRRRGFDIRALFTALMLIVSPVKFHSPRRRDQLEAVGRLFAVAKRVSTESASLMAWAAEALPFLHVAIWDFPCFYSVTRLRRPRPP